MARIRCERCGQALKNSNGAGRHKNTCDQLPTPLEMAWHVIKRKISVAEYGRELSDIASLYTISVRVKRGLDQIKKSDPETFESYRVWRYKHTSERRQEMAESHAAGRAERNNSILCDRCDIMKKSIVVQEALERGGRWVGGLCPFCVQDLRRSTVSDELKGAIIL